MRRWANSTDLRVERPGTRPGRPSRSPRGACGWSDTPTAVGGRVLGRVGRLRLRRGRLARQRRLRLGEGQGYQRPQGHGGYRTQHQDPALTPGGRPPTAVGVSLQPQAPRGDRDGRPGRVPARAMRQAVLLAHFRTPHNPADSHGWLPKAARSYSYLAISSNKIIDCSLCREVHDHQHARPRCAFSPDNVVRIGYERARL